MATHDGAKSHDCRQGREEGDSQRRNSVKKPEDMAARTGAGERQDTEADLRLEQQDEGTDPADGAVVGAALLLDEDVLGDGRLGDTDTVELLLGGRKGSRVSQGRSLDDCARAATEERSGGKRGADLAVPDAGARARVLGFDDAALLGGAAVKVVDGLGLVDLGRGLAGGRVDHGARA